MKSAPRTRTNARLFRSCIVASVLIAAGSLWSLLANAGDGTETGTLSLVFENDLFYDTDRNYTNGVRASWLSSPDGRPAWALRAARWFPLFPDGGAVRTSYAVGQNMYTPEDIALRDPPLDDRPYAGWLYGSIGLIAETGRRLDQLELTLGVVGPASLAEQTQTFVHEITGSRGPRGWDTQRQRPESFAHLIKRRRLPRG